MNNTPAPWIRDTHPILLYEENSESQYIVIFGPDGPGWGRVAMVFAELGREDELEPNAILIAASPALLKVYEVASNIFHGSEALATALREAREALDR